MKVLLIDADSKIPNLALMKISQYHKLKGDEVGFFTSDPDKVYCSIIFKKNRHLADGLHLMYPNAEIDIGGSGYDLNKRLPYEIEMMTPDYDLYPDCDSYYGFTTRGCIRNCHFCIVRQKEGSLRRIYHSPGECLDNIRHGYTKKKITLMDNNILADKDWFMSLTIMIMMMGLKIDFNQGLDIRLVDEDIAKRLASLRPINVWHFAFDDERYTDAVISGIQCLKRNGVDVRHRTMFYVYIHNDSDYDSALRRCMILKDYGATPYIMLNQETEHTRRMKDLKRWCRPWIFWKIDIEEYTTKVRK